MRSNKETKSLEFDIPKENCQLEYFGLTREKFFVEETFHLLDCNHGGREILHDHNFPSDNMTTTAPARGYN